MVTFEAKLINSVSNLIIVPFTQFLDEKSGISKRKLQEKVFRITC